MTKFKHIKLFESFVNEELSPELKKRTYDEMMKVANDPKSIERSKRFQQAENVLKSLSPAVEKLKKELEDHANRVMSSQMGSTAPSFKVDFYDYGLSSERTYGYLNMYVECPGVGLTILGLSIFKDRYQKLRSQSDGDERRLYSDRAFVGTLKKLIVQIQKDEIPGDEQVLEQPESITPGGEI
jgi:hypothetical protein